MNIDTYINYAHPPLCYGCIMCCKNDVTGSQLSCLLCSYSLQEYKKQCMDTFLYWVISKLYGRKQFSICKMTRCKSIMLLYVGVVLLSITIFIGGLIHISVFVPLGNTGKHDKLQQAYDNVHGVKATPTTQ